MTQLTRLFSLIAFMSRRSHSASPSPRLSKRAKPDHLTNEDFKNGVFLAPMVRSGARMSGVQLV
jgi:hypothetical protein